MSVTCLWQFPSPHLSFMILTLELWSGSPSHCLCEVPISEILARTPQEGCCALLGASCQETRGKGNFSLGYVLLCKEELPFSPFFFLHVICYITVGSIIIGTQIGHYILFLKLSQVWSGKTVPAGFNMSLSLCCGCWYTLGYL